MKKLIKISVFVFLFVSILVTPAAGLAGNQPAEKAAESKQIIQDPGDDPEPNCLPVPIPSAKLEKIADNLSSPVEIKHAGDGSNRLFIVQQTGEILILKDSGLLPIPFFDISSDVACCNETGLLSVAFHPDYETNGYFYIYYTRDTGNPTQPESRVVRYSVSANPDLADMTSGEILLQFQQPYLRHNGGQLHFGPEGYLYISFGDGGSSGDPDDRAQDLNSFFGTMLRIDVDSGTPYSIPVDNPFLESPDDPNTLSEIWLYGLRNPWRFSFDRLTGDLLIGDVGQNAYEEIDYLAAGSSGGVNFGWRCYEADAAYNLAGCGPIGNYTFPILSYLHDTEPCYSVTGGYVYRGTEINAIQGKYVYGDYCTGQIWLGEKNPDSSWSSEPLLDTDHKITSFGEDESGELYLVHYDASVGQLYKLVEDLTEKVGFYVPSQKNWYLKNNLSNGWTDLVTTKFGGSSEYKPVTGDWNGDGVDTIGFYVPSQKMWFLKNGLSSGWTDITAFKFGGTSEFIPVTGDWDNDGEDTVGFYVPSQKTWYLKNNQINGWNEYISFQFGGPTDWVPVVGDWNNDGMDTSGFYNPSQKTWHLKNSQTDGWNDFISFQFGGPADWLPVVGDWNGDGVDTVGHLAPGQKIWYLKNTHADSWNEYIYVRFGGAAGGIPVVGDWD